jgi:uncharacterized membrane protein
MSNKNEQKNKTDVEREVIRAVARLKAGILGLVFGLIFGVGLFAMTAILLIEAGPNTGLHLRLLGNFFIGYTITWKGAFIGFFWAFATGALIGWSIGIIYNRIIEIRTNAWKK